MHIVSFVYPNFRQGPQEVNAYYLPYSSGVLWAYACQFPAITDNFKLGEFVWKREPIEPAAIRLAESSVIGFSNYIWNKNYNYALAKRIKEINPKCLIVFGGPETPTEHNDIFVRHPYINLCVRKEGEEVFKCILETFLKSRIFNTVPGLLINHKGTVIRTPDQSRLEAKISPYLAGHFDHILESGLATEWNAIMETNRGCPYACTFCDWGSLSYNKVKKFELPQVMDELEWIGKNKISFVSFADANFGMFIERDGAVVDKIIQTQKAYGYPKSYTMTWAKNQSDEVIKMAKRFIDNGNRYGLTLSVQSLNPTTLTKIKRKNLPINRIEEVFAKCEKENIPVFTEIILGLPGETLETWKYNYYRLFEAENHSSIAMYNTLLLENAELNLTQRATEQIGSVIVHDAFGNDDELYGHEETVEIVTSTASMPYNELLDATMFTWFMHTFHINGLTSVLSRFAFKYAEVEYSEFYDKLYNYFIEHSEWFVKEEAKVRAYYNDWYTIGRTNHPPIGKLHVHGAMIYGITTFTIHLDEKYDEIHTLLKNFYCETFPDQLAFIDDLLTVQTSYAIRYPDLALYPKRMLLDHNIMGYLQSDEILEQPTEHCFDFVGDKSVSKMRFCENVWFGKRSNFGKSIVTYQQV